MYSRTLSSFYSESLKNIAQRKIPTTGSFLPFVKKKQKTKKKTKQKKQSTSVEMENGRPIQTENE